MILKTAAYCLQPKSHITISVTGAVHNKFTMLALTFMTNTTLLLLIQVYVLSCPLRWVSKVFPLNRNFPKHLSYLFLYGRMSCHHNC